MGQHFRKAAKGMTFPVTGAWSDFAYEYAVKAIGGIFGSFSDEDSIRPWMSEIDFIDALAAAIREHFPPKILANVSNDTFDNAVRLVHDRAFEESRMELNLQSVMRSQNLEKQQRKKSLKAFTKGWKVAVDSFY